jgi:hypothetical protein
MAMHPSDKADCQRVVLALTDLLKNSTHVICPDAIRAIAAERNRIEANIK